MKIEIKKRWNDNIILCGEYESIKDCLEKNRGANLYEANLYRANLYEANLSGANLYEADLYEANLSGANLYEADLSGANLSGANLYRANLYEANLSGANLYEADLSGANLSGANLSGANLYGANLYEADLSGANLYRANLYEADLYEAKNFDENLCISFTTITPEGDLIGWKKCRDNIIVKVKIPQKAKRSNSTGRKCRAEYVKVLEIFGGDVGISEHDEKTKYVVGKTVKCNEWGDNRWEECSGGIHFFLTKLEAERY